MLEGARFTGRGMLVVVVRLILILVIGECIAELSRYMLCHDWTLSSSEGSSAWSRGPSQYRGSEHRNLQIDCLLN